MKNKIVILLFGIFFSIVSPLLLTESIIENCNDLRRNYLIAENLTTETIEITSEQWNSLTDKKEIFYKNEYYDIKKIVQNRQKIALTLVKDSFENVIKISLNDKTSKKEKDKKPITFFAEYEISSLSKRLLYCIQKPLSSNKVIQIEYNSYIFSLKKPPIC